MQGWQPPVWFRGNGCTCSPDGHWHEACRWHDWHYVIGVNRRQADRWFLQNLIELDHPLPLSYWLATRLFGGLFWWRLRWRELKRGGRIRYGIHRQ